MISFLHLLETNFIVYHFMKNILFIVQEKESESEEKEKAEGTKDVEKKEEIETNEAKKIVEALTGTDASTCKKLQ